MACCMRCSKGLKICCGVTAILIILLLVIMVVLFFTVFKPKDPTIILQSVKFERLNLVVFPDIELNVSLGTVVTVENPNHGSFSYQNSTSYLNYRGNLVAEAAINEDTIPARGAHNISTSLNIFADNLTKFQGFPGDFARGVINFTSATTLVGNVGILDLFKMKATSYSICDISVFKQDMSVNFTCNSKIKL